MYTGRKRTILILLCSLIAALLLAACGGGSAEVPDGVQQGNGELPGTIGDISSQPAASDFPVAQPIEGQSSEAPLGTDPQYNMTPISGQQGSFGEITEVKGSSAVVIPPSGFDVLDVTIMADGVAPDWTLASASFVEGDAVDLWVKFNTYGTGSQELVLRWISATINLNLTEAPKIYSEEGEYTVKIDYAIPFVGAQPDASLQVDISEAGALESSDPFPYSIVAMDSSTVTYPVGSDGDASLGSFSSGYAQMGWEDLLSNSDYDYNDFVGRMKVVETRDSLDRLVQIEMTIKAVARAAGYNSDFQLNMSGAFPGGSITAIVDQYYDGQYNPDGTPKRHGNQRAWQSSDGVSLPIFTPIRNALPNPPGSYATNGIAGTKYISGDYAVVKIVFATPIPQGQYTPAPYKPELRVKASDSNIYIIGLWKKKGDWVDSNGRPLAFIVPDTYAWPLEGVRIWTVFPGFNNWVSWINDGSSESSPPAPSWFNTDPAPASLYFQKSLFLP